MLLIGTTLAIAPMASQARTLPTGRIIAIFGNSSFPFATARVVISQGSTVTFTNLDVALHNVTSSRFSSASIGLAKSTPVNGTASLPPGTYAFRCTFHPLMTGALIVKKVG